MYKFYIYRCKFQNQISSFQALLSFIRLKIKSEYIIAKQNDELHKHLKKFKFSIWFFPHLFICLVFINSFSNWLILMFVLVLSLFFISFIFYCKLK